MDTKLQLAGCAVVRVTRRMLDRDATRTVGNVRQLLADRNLD